MERFGSEKGTSAPGETEQDKEQRLIQLRRAIQRAETRNEEREVVLLENELRAVESGQPFDREAAIANLNFGDKKRVLAQMQSLSTKHDDTWNWDGVYHEARQDMHYDTQFQQELQMAGYSSMLELVQGRAEVLGREVSALDLFGGAYFLHDLDHVSHLLGVRLKNKDEEYGEERERGAGYVKWLTDNPKRDILEGNLYEGSTWKRIQSYEKEKDIVGFDLIVCRPQGPFGHMATNEYKSTQDVERTPENSSGAVYKALLDRTLDLMSVDDGLFFLQIPVVNIDLPTVREFWKEYESAKKKEGYDFYFDNARPELSKQVLIRRRPKPAPHTP